MNMLVLIEKKTHSAYFILVLVFCLFQSAKDFPGNVTPEFYFLILYLSIS